MEFFVGLAICLMIQSLAMLVPGQNHFMLVSLASLGARALAMCVLGIALAGVVFSTSVVLSIWLGGQGLSDIWFTFLNILGASYLIYLGIKLLIAAWRGLQIRATTAPQHAPTKPLYNNPLSLKSSFRSGFLVNISNSKSALFFASVFATTLPLAELNLFYAGLAIIAFFLNSLLFHGIVAGFFTMPKVQIIIARWNNLINLIAGFVFVGFGVTSASVTIGNLPE